MINIDTFKITGTKEIIPKVETVKKNFGIIIGYQYKEYLINLLKNIKLPEYWNRPVEIINPFVVKYNITTEYINKIVFVCYNITQWQEMLKDIPNIIVISNIMYNEFVKDNEMYAMYVFDNVDTLNINKSVIPNTNYVLFHATNIINLLAPTKHYTDNNNWVRKTQGVNSTGFIRDFFISIPNIPDINENILLLENKEKKFNVKYHKCKTPNEIQLLSDILNKDVIRMLNGNDYSSAMKYLGYQMESKEKILSLILEDIENKIKNNETLEEEYETLKNKKTNIMNRINETFVCPICMETLGISKAVLNCCHNVYDFNCIHSYLQNSTKCPLCREEVNVKSNLLLMEPSGSPDELHKINILTKEKIIHKLIQDNPSAIYGIYSEFEPPFDYLLKILPKNYPYQRFKNPADFIQKDETKLFLMNAKYYYYSINLNITDLIIYHQMSKNIIEGILSIIPEGINVHYLCHSNEIISI